MEKNSANFSVEEAMKLAATPAGQQLVAFLRQQNSTALQQAAQQATTGNMGGAQQALSQLLGDPRVRELLTKIQEGSHG